MHFRIHIISECCILLHLMEPKGRCTTEVYTVKKDPVSNKPRAYLAAIYQYPTVRTHLIESELIVYTTSHNATSLARTIPFFPNVASSVICIRRTYHRHQQGWILVTHLMSGAVFVAAAESFDPKHESTTTMSWDVWGPYHAHCSVETSDSNEALQDVLILSGSKVMFSNFTWLDFNPAFITRTLQSAGKRVNSKRSAQMYLEDRRNTIKKLLLHFKRAEKKQHLQHPDVRIPGISGVIVQYPSVIPAGEWFYHDVISTVPYRKIALNEFASGAAGAHESAAVPGSSSHFWFTFRPEDTVSHVPKKKCRFSLVVTKAHYGVFRWN